jgi:hypothetical protein
VVEERQSGLYFSSYCLRFNVRISEINPTTANTNPKIMAIVFTGCLKVDVIANPNKTQPPVIAPIEIMICSFFVK